MRSMPMLRRSHPLTAICYKQIKQGMRGRNFTPLFAADVGGQAALFKKPLTQ